MITIDGSYGEGGGQILRTSLSLAAITGQPLRLEGIRAGRPKPGLAAQHLTSVRATAAICQAQLLGAALGSTFLEFIPTKPTQAGNYTFDVTEAREGGSAGAVTLILQTILLPLALTTGESVILLKGGTHVPWSPPIPYIEDVYLPFVRELGIEAEVKLRAWGWYPAGGGEVEVRLRGGSTLKGIQLLERGNLQGIRGFAAVTELPSHIPQCMANRAENLLAQEDLKAQIQPLREKGKTPGAGIFLTVLYDYTRAGFSALGRQRLPAERVAEMAVQELLEFHGQEAPIDEHLADQLLLPLALAKESSQYRVAKVTEHLQTNAWVISQFGMAKIDIDPESKIVSVVPN